MTKPSIERVSESRCFDGRQIVYKHESSACACTMRFAVYLPPAAERAPVPALYWLSGLTCTEENFSVKAGAQRHAAELGVALIIPDTSPRGVNIPGEDAQMDVGTGAGFLRQCDGGAVGGALPHVRLHSRRAAGRRERAIYPSIRHGNRSAATRWAATARSSSASVTRRATARYPRSRRLRRRVNRPGGNTR